MRNLNNNNNKYILVPALMPINSLNLSLNHNHSKPGYNLHSHNNYHLFQ